MKVRVISQRGTSALVEYQFNDTWKRCYIPADKVKENECDLDVLHMGIPYGADWEELLSGYTLDTSMVANDLHRHGIWNIDDLKKNPAIINGLIVKALGFSVGKFIADNKTPKEEE